MDHIPQPSLMSGEALRLLRNRNAAGALRLHAEAYQERQLFTTLGNPVLLASQTPEWVDTAQTIYPAAHTDWIRAVQSRAKNFPAEIVHAVATACKRDDRKIQRPTLCYCGKADIVFLNLCPLCSNEQVRLLRVDPATFTAPLLISRILQLRSCNHRLPLDGSLWQAIVNANALASKQLIDLC